MPFLVVAKLSQKEQPMRRNPIFSVTLSVLIFGFLVAESEPLATRRSDAHQMLDLMIGGAAR